MTAVEWLFEKLWQLPKDKFTWYNVLEQAKEIEKQQIIDALTYGNKSELMASQKMFAEQYYNETYGSGVLTEGSGAVGEKGGAVTSSQTEISDEEIEKAAAHYEPMVTRRAWVSACKWYREQLKSK